MGKIGARILYLLIAVSFISSAFLSSSYITDDGTQAFMVFFETEFEVKTELYNAMAWVSTVFTSSILIIFINMYRLAKKDTAITQGTLDAKQNQSLSNDIVVMNSFKWMLDTVLMVGDQSKKELIKSDLDSCIVSSTKLSQTRIDISAAPISAQIEMKESFIKSMEIQLQNAIDGGDFNLKAQIESLINIARTEIEKLLKSKM